MMHIVRWIVGAALFLALLFLSLQNSEKVTLKFYNLWGFEAPLVFVVLIAFAVGVAAGLLAGALRASKLRRQVNRLTRAEKARADGNAPLPGERTRTGA
jgi:lipopolysaccharide assembly protein A